MQYIKIISKFFRIIVKSVMILVLICFVFNIWWTYIYGRQRIYNLGNDQYVTVWKRVGGECFIMPYKYCGLTLPEKNFIVVHNLGGLDIFFSNDSTLLIHKGGGIQKIKGIYLPDYKYEYFAGLDFSKIPMSEVADTLKSYDREKEKLKRFPWISISVREPSITAHPK